VISRWGQALPLGKDIFLAFVLMAFSKIRPDPTYGKKCLPLEASPFTLLEKVLGNTLAPNQIFNAILYSLFSAAA